MSAYDDIKIGADIASALLENLVISGWGEKPASELVEPFKDALALALREIEG